MHEHEYSHLRLSMKKEQQQKKSNKYGIKSFEWTVLEGYGQELRH